MKNKNKSIKGQSEMLRKLRILVCFGAVFLL